MKEILVCKGLSKSYGRFPALSEASFNFYGGRIIGLLGPNGSGKSTFIKIAAGLIKPTSGELTICSKKIGIKTKSIVSYLPDRDFLPEGMRISQLIKMYSEFYKDFDSIKAVDLLSRLGVDLNKRFKDLSKGTKEKIQLSLVMSRRAKLYLLDEPIGVIDPAARDFMIGTILSNINNRSTVVISTHLIHDIEGVLDDVIMLQNGTVRFYDSAENLRAQTGKSIDEFFREVYRC